MSSDAEKCGIVAGITTIIYYIVVFVIVVIVGAILAVHFINEGSSCEGEYRDFPLTKGSDDAYTFYVDEKGLTLKNEAFVYDTNDNKIGKYFQKYGSVRTKFRIQYRNETNDNEKRVVGKVTQELLSIGRDYDVEICDGSIGNFKIDQKFNFLEDEFEIEQEDANGEFHVIAKSSKKTFFSFLPDITIVDNNDNLIGICGRGLSSIFLDRWECKNYKPDKLPHIMLGLMAYLATWQENQDNKIATDTSGCASHNGVMSSIL